jgi:transcriptional regulator with XRE-family HTH domain
LIHTAAGTTQRHLSFIESGRSAPGRGMVIRLAESLGLPLRERNELLLTAGYAPAYPQTPLDSTELAPVMAALTYIIDAHMPYPAIIIDRYGEIIAANAAQQILAENAACHVRSNAYRLALHPEGMAPRIGNFPEWARHASDRNLPGRTLVATTKTVHDQVEGELESIQCGAGRQLSCVALGVGEGVG